VSFKSEIDTLIAVMGLILFISGLYLWLGLPAALMILGLALIYTGVRLDPATLWSKHEPDQTTHPDQP
jgi:multisubunit Na+/H+ antiporter MnhC subunit